MPDAVRENFAKRGDEVVPKSDWRIVQSLVLGVTPTDCNGNAVDPQFVRVDVNGSSFSCPPSVAREIAVALQWQADLAEGVLSEEDRIKERPQLAFSN